jgi:hypothetical protein
MNAAQAHDRLTAALYLRAVLPAFEELGRVSPRAQALIADWDCGVEFAVHGAEGATVNFQNGTVAVSPDRSLKAAISLLFLSPGQLAKMFAGKFAAPLPRRGFWRVASLQRFLKISKILEQELEQHPRLLLSVALGSLAPLIEHDAHARAAMRDCPPGVVELCLPAHDLYAWMEWRNGKISWARGRSAKPADAVVTFRDEATALAALRGELDELAAIGRGDLTLRGLLPLAETLGVVMALADNYIERRTP